MWRTQTKRVIPVKYLPMRARTQATDSSWTKENLRRALRLKSPKITTRKVSSNRPLQLARWNAHETSEHSLPGRVSFASQARWLYDKHHRGILVLRAEWVDERERIFHRDTASRNTPCSPQNSTSQQKYFLTTYITPSLRPMFALAVTTSPAIRGNSTATSSQQPAFVFNFTKCLLYKQSWAFDDLWRNHVVS